MPEAGTAASLLVFGLAVGMKHALEADHLAAVAALATRSRTVRQTVFQGMAWGAGHTFTLLVFGCVVLSMHTAVPARLASLLEGAVGVMLVVLGVDVLRRLRRERVRVHVHGHGEGVSHLHVHSHAHEAAPHDPRAHRHALPVGLALRALLVGMMHGLAGTAAVVLLAAGSTGSIALGLAQIASFGAGSIIGMAALSVALAWPLRLSSRYFAPMRGVLHALVGLASVGLGLGLMYDTLL